MTLTCFKAYDIRGKLGEELDEDIAYRIGRAYARFLKPKTVVVGGDMRLTSEALKQAVARGIQDEGADVIDIGLCGTEEIYFATTHLQTDGGIVVTASHNPIDYNGMKMVREGSRPISGDSGLHDIQRLAEANDFGEPAQSLGNYRKESVLDAYVQHLLSYVDVNQLKPLKLVVNAGNGAAGHVIDALEPHLPFEFVKIHHEADGNFPNGIPNPLLPENRAVTSNAVIEAKADMGIAWDGDFDRCFLFDEHGAFTEGYYIVGLLAEAFLIKVPGSKVIHDPRLIWNTIDIAERNGGTAIQSKTGHSFIKERMRNEDAIYGGEMSAHHYFRDFAYCDSGMIPWLLVADGICMLPAGGESNRTVSDTAKAIERVLERYRADAKTVDKTDGISWEFDDWRFNLRMSNTEPVVRLNAESRGDVELVQRKTKEVLALLNQSDD